MMETLLQASDDREQRTPKNEDAEVEMAFRRGDHQPTLLTDPASISRKAYLGIDPSQICSGGAPSPNQIQKGGESQEDELKKGGIMNLCFQGRL
jgi:hypothetical protein